MAYALAPKGKKKPSHSIKGGMKGIGQVMHNMKQDAMHGYNKKKK